MGAILSALATLPAEAGGRKASVVAVGPQDQPADWIAQRQVRLSRAADGAYIVIEVLDVEVRGGEGASSLAEPLALIRLPDPAGSVRWLGGDLSPGHLSLENGRLGILGSVPTGTVRFAAGYRLPPETRELRLQALVPIDTLSLFVDRGTLEARPDPALAAAGSTGPRQLPRLEYVASDIEAGKSFRVDLIDERLGWRQRVAVLLATTVLASLAGFHVWRRAQRAPPA